MIGLMKMKKIKLDKQIYSIPYVLQAINDYKSFANIISYEDSSNIIVMLNNCKYGNDKTTHEFENYIIELMNNRG